MAAPDQPAAIVDSSRNGAKIRIGPEGVHLFDRDSGVNVLLDEVHSPPSDWSQGPRFVSFALTNACDLECAYCYAPKHVARLIAPTVAAWASELDEAGTLGVGFGGGEPTLFPGFAELCRTIHSETRLAISATTHGHHWTPKLLEALGDSLQFVRVSMDGVGETYARLRGRSFSSFTEKLRLIGSQYRFGLNVVVNGATLPELDAIAQYASDHGAQELLLLPQVGANGRSTLDEAATEELNRWIGTNHLDLRLSISATSADRISAPMLPITAPGFADRDFMHVDAAGTLRLCAYGGEGVPLAPGQSILDGIARLRAGLAASLQGGMT